MLLVSLVLGVPIAEPGAAVSVLLVNATIALPGLVALGCLSASRTSTTLAGVLQESFHLQG